MTRALEPDRGYTAPDGRPFTLPGRSLLFVRNVGHLMTTPAIRLPDGAEAPEGILDGIVTSLIALHDLEARGPLRQQPRGLDLYRQAQDARPGGSRPSPTGCSTRSRICSVCRATPSRSA